VVNLHLAQVEINSSPLTLKKLGQLFEIKLTIISLDSGQYFSVRPFDDGHFVLSSTTICIMGFRYLVIIRLQILRQTLTLGVA